jgi:hypothetical protein
MIILITLSPPFRVILVSSCAIGCHLLHSRKLLCVLCMPSAICPPLSALCLMSLALCGLVGCYLLFVSDSCCGLVAWFEHVLLPSCVICCHVLHSGNLLCAPCMPSVLHSLPSASCHWPCVVLWGVTFFLSQTSVVVWWHGLNMCCCPLVLYVAICCTLATCCGPHACPLSSTLCPLPHVTGLVWSCGVLPSFCLRRLVCFCALLCYLLPFVAFWQFAMCPMHALCPLPSTLCPLCGPVGCCLRFAPDTWVCSHYLFYSLLPSASSAAICCPLLLNGLLSSMAALAFSSHPEGLLCALLYEAK